MSTADATARAAAGLAVLRRMTTAAPPPEPATMRDALAALEAAVAAGDTEREARAWHAVGAIVARTSYTRTLLMVLASRGAEGRSWRGVGALAARRAADARVILGTEAPGA